MGISVAKRIDVEDLAEAPAGLCHQLRQSKIDQEEAGREVFGSHPPDLPGSVGPGLVRSGERDCVDNDVSVEHRGYVSTEPMRIADPRSHSCRGINGPLSISI